MQSADESFGLLGSSGLQKGHTDIHIYKVYCMYLDKTEYQYPYNYYYLLHIYMNIHMVHVQCISICVRVWGPHFMVLSSEAVQFELSLWVPLSDLHC